MRRIDELHLDYQFGGTRMLVRMLRREDFVVGRKQREHVDEERERPQRCIAS